MLPEIEAAVQGALGQPASSFASVEAALGEAIRQSESRAADAERIAALRVEALAELDRRIGDLEKIARLRTEREATAQRMKAVDAALKGVDGCRNQAKKVSEAADTVRSEIVKKVFSTSLNTVWRISLCG